MGEGIGIWLHPNTGQVLVSESLYTAGGVLAWLVALVLGLATSWLVLP
jgi:hypothetical protein